MQSPRDLQSARDRVTAWMADGRADLVVRAWNDAFEDAWREDPYLLLQYGDALGKLDRLAEADRVFRRASLLDAASDAQKQFAQRRLEWLETEWARIEDVRSGLGRAVTVGIAGACLLAAFAGLTWIVGRRDEISVAPRVENEH